jgi:hypothetical protein
MSHPAHVTATLFGSGSTNGDGNFVILVAAGQEAGMSQIFDNAEDLTGYGRSNLQH